MRQQYHSRQTDNGLYVWDVRKLVELGRHMPVIDVNLTDIQELDEAYWFLAGNPYPTVRDIAVHAMLIEKCDLSYPIILCAEGRVMDGMHRCCRALIDGRKTVQAVQFAQTPKPHYVDVPLDSLPHDDPVIL